MVELDMPETSPTAYDAINFANPPEAAPVEASPSAEELDMLDDEVMIDAAPDRPCGTTRVKLVYTGRSMPIPADDRSTQRPLDSNHRLKRLVARYI